MKAVIFTHAPDLLGALLACQALRKIGVQPVLALEKSDPYFHVEIAEVVRTDFPRRGNLNGTHCASGMLKCLMEAAEPADEWVLKVDADTIVRSLDWLEGADDVGAMVGCQVDPNYGIIGCCYALRVSALPELLDQMDRFRVDVGAGEDRLMTEAAGRLRGVRGLAWNDPACPFGCWQWQQEEPDLDYYRGKQVIEVNRRKGPREQVPEKMRILLGL